MPGIAASAGQIGTAWFADELHGTIEVSPNAASATVLLERSAPAGAMTPLHRRDEHETYRVLSGVVTFYVRDEIVSARPGDVVVAPAGAARTLRADSDDARWLVLTCVASLDRYLDFGRAVARPLDGADFSPEDRAGLGAIAAANGIELLGPPGALPGDREQHRSY